MLARRPIRDDAAEIRALLPLLIAAIAGSGVALVAGYMVNERVGQGPAWIVPGLLYYQHLLHATAIAEMTRSAPGIVLVVPLALALVVLLLMYRNTPRLRLAHLPLWLRLGAGLFTGGCVANLVELLARGSVVDFVGIRGLGVFSVGDLELDVGVAALVAGWWLYASGGRLRGRHLVAAYALLLAPAVYLAINYEEARLLLAYVLDAGLGLSAALLSASLRSVPEKRNYLSRRGAVARGRSAGTRPD